MRTRSFVAVLAVLTIVSGAGAALARNGTPQPAVAEGRLWADGTGSAVLHMGGTLSLAMTGRVLVQDISGDAVVTVDGGADHRLTELAPYGEVWTAEGTHYLEITGSDFIVEVHDHIRFDASGAGTSVFSGSGLWRTTDRREAWTRDGVTVALAD